MKQGKISYAFPGGNTTKGFHSFYKDGLKNFERVFILKGGPGCGKSTLMRRIGSAMADRGYDIEFWICSSDNDSLDGILIPALSIAIIDGTAPHTMDPRYPGAVESIVNLGDNWDEEILLAEKEQILNLTNDISAKFGLAYEKLAQMGSLRREQAKIAVSELDESLLPREIEKILTEIYQKDDDKSNRLFSSAVTPQGLIRQAHNLSKSYPRRYIITGGPGGGKERIFAAAVEAAKEGGHESKIFFAGFDSAEVELLLLPEQGAALIAEEAIDKKDISDADIIINPPSSHEKTDKQKELKEQASLLLDEAIAKIGEAKALHDKLEAIYIKAMDFEAVDFAASRLFNKILTLAAKKEGQR